MRQLASCLFAVALVACSSPGPDATATAPAAPTPSRAHHEVVLEGPGGQRLAFDAEIAADPDARRRGLMHRTDLPDDAGMLFVYPEDTDSGFWMKDTLVPLSIAFARADGAVVAVLDMEPCTGDPCPVYRPGAAYRYALEVNVGALEGVGGGWHMDVPDDLPPAS